MISSHHKSLSPRQTIEELWEEYRSIGSEAARNGLVEKYLPLVKYNAERIHKRLPDEIDVDDLMSAGVFGLMDALAAFSTDRGVKFETYAAPRIRGSILDELRSMDWVPRLVRSRSSQADSARQSFYKKSGRPPVDDEIAQRMNLDREQFNKIRKDSRSVNVVSLARKWFETDSGKDMHEVDRYIDAGQMDPFEMVSRRDMRQMIIAGLSRAERLIIILYYYEEMTMREIGEAVGLSESRISQIRSSILARLRAKLGHRSKELFEN